MKFLSLFSGIGGFDLGLERAGMECVGQVEIDDACNAVLDARFPLCERNRDVRNYAIETDNNDLCECCDDTWCSIHDEHYQDCDCVDGMEVPEHDLIVGGFPCQDVSVAGKGRGIHAKRSQTWFEFHRIVQRLRPRWALIENVPGLLSSNQGRDFAVILDGLVQCGFGGISWAVLDSQYFGVPQTRRRLFIACGPSASSAEFVLSVCENDGCDPGSPVMERRAGETFLVVQDARPMSIKKQNGSGIRESTAVCYTLDATSRHAVEMAEGLRYFMPLEWERMQGFPDGWTEIDGIADRDRYRMIGNAVTVSVIEWIGKRIMEVEMSARTHD